MTTQISTQTISFNNQALITFEQNGTHYTAMKPICENIGLDWTAQAQRLKRDEILNSTMVIITIVAEDGKQREMICLPIEYLNGWLFGIDVNRCKPEIRETLIKYKKECYQALHDYWFKGKAERKAKQLALPQPEKKFTIELTEGEMMDLAWVWFAYVRSVHAFREIQQQLKSLGSKFSPIVYGLAYEYTVTAKNAHRVINRITKDIPFDTESNWRVLKHVRNFDPTFKESIL